MSSTSLPFKVNVNAELSTWRVDTFWDKEPETIAWLDYFSAESSLRVDSLIDVGANIGMFSLYWLSKRNLSTCISCEPFGTNRQLLNENLDLNNFSSRATIIDSPISSKSEIGNYEIPDLRPGASSFKFSLGNEVISESFNSTHSITIDDLLKNVNYQHILKIDVDGGDFDVLKGAVNSLKNDAIISVLIESDEKQQKEIEIFLSVFGFKADEKFNNLNPHSDLRRIGAGKIERNRVYSRM
jgi:FkbM family methyltransferase